MTDAIVRLTASAICRKNEDMAKLDLVRGDGFFLEIFTWKNAAIPDNAPPEVLGSWKQMNAPVTTSGRATSRRTGRATS